MNDGRPGGCNRGDTAAFTKGESAQVIAHELGHNLFRLGDEYTSDTQNFAGTATQANLTEQPASWNALKWGALVAAGTPLPTDPGALPAGWNNRTSVGAFEGGGARFSTGILRPVLECRMNQNNPPWRPVCGQEIARQPQQVVSGVHDERLRRELTAAQVTAPRKTADRRAPAEGFFDSLTHALSQPIPLRAGSAPRPATCHPFR